MIDFPNAPVVDQIVSSPDGLNAWKWNGSAWLAVTNGVVGIQGPTGPVGPAGPAGPQGPAGPVSSASGTRLWSAGANYYGNPLYADYRFDIPIYDGAGVFPFPTIAICTVSGLYVWSDRQTTQTCYIYDAAVVGWDGDGWMRHDFTSGNSRGTQWTSHSGMTGTRYMVANEGAPPAWLVRAETVVGGVTGGGVTFYYSLERFRV